MNTDYKVAIYLRLSREDEKLGESGSISNQRDLLLNYIKDNHLHLVDEYIDDGVSGTTFDRAGFNRLIKDCENKKINMIITKDTSRLGRDHIEFGFYVERYFPEHNIRYVAVNDGIDTSVNSSANDMLVFKSAFNDMYVKDISNKLRSSLNTKKRNGQFVGAYAPYGYKKSNLDKHKLIINEEEAIIVRRIFNMFKSGYSLNKICDTLTNQNIKTPSMSKNMNIGQNNYHYGIWSTKTINDILKNPTYIGNLTQCRQKKVNYKSKKRIHNKMSEWIISPNALEPIIDEVTFNLVQDMFKSNKYRKNDGITDKLLLRGLIFCKECSHTLGFRAHKQLTKKYGEVTRIYGNCNYWAKRKKQNVCTPHSIKYSDIEDIVLNKLKEIFNKHIDEEFTNSIITKYDKGKRSKEKIQLEINKIDKTMENLNKKIDACYNDKLDGNITFEMYKRISNNLITDLKKYEEKKENYKKNLLDLDNNQDYSYIKKIKEYLNLNNPSRLLICSLIDKIEIDEDKNIDIYYKFNLN